MKRQFIVLGLLSMSIAFGGCAIYPTIRTFYEVDPADGTPMNRSSCGYTRTKDSAERIVQGVEIIISPGDEELPDNPSPTLRTWLSFSIPKQMDGVLIDPARVHVEIDGVLMVPEILSSTDREIRTAKGLYYWKLVELVYPPPSGEQPQVKFVFLQDALQINGKNVPVAPFRFSRVTKSDLYYGSINC